MNAYMCIKKLSSTNNENAEVRVYRLKKTSRVTTKTTKNNESLYLLSGLKCTVYTTKDQLPITDTESNHSLLILIVLKHVQGV